MHTLNMTIDCLATFIVSFNYQNITETSDKVHVHVQLKLIKVFLISA